MNFFRDFLYSKVCHEFFVLKYFFHISPPKSQVYTDTRLKDKNLGARADDKACGETLEDQQII